MASQQADQAHHAGGHVVPGHVLVAVFIALLVLTALTVAATWVDLGPGNLFVAIGIATVKAALVALFFMHLRYDHPFYGLVFTLAILFLALFLGLTLVDVRQTFPEVQAALENPV